jgi:HK97 family phage prohead protease
VSDLALFTGGTLTAAATTDPEPRTAEGILVPYGQPGRTNLGPKRIAPGALRLVAAAPVIGLNGHDRDQPVSRLIASEDRPEGLWGRLRIAQTPAGDALLAEIRDGVRDGLSVELSDLAFDPADPDLVISARLDAVAHVPLPAYDSARVSALAASLHDDQGDSVSDTAAPATVTPAAPAIDYTQLAAALAPHLTAAAAPAGLPTGALTAAPASPGLAPSAAPRIDPETDTVRHAAHLMAALQQGSATPEMRAALVDITNSGLPLFQNRSTLGEKLWEGAGYTRRFVQLMRGKQLTDWKFTGWEWVESPRVQDYAGDKAEVPSNPVKIRAVEQSARRLAGAWDIDRRFVDFNSPEFWEEFWAAGTESYAVESDLRAAQAIVDYAVDVTDAASYPTWNDSGTTRPLYAAPDGFTGLLVAQDDVLQAAALANAILTNTPRVRRAPDYILMNTTDWLSLSRLTNLDLPAFLTLLKVDPGNFDHSPLVPAGQIIAGVRQAATYRELGSVPIRVEALDIAHGGTDRGLFGYTGISHDRVGGIISVPLAAAGA